MRDAEIRNSLRHSFLRKYYLDKHSKVVNELSIGFGDAIIDMAVINGSLHGFEIKSEYDTLNRLPNQLTAYIKTFDFLTVISAKKHLNHLLPLLPDWCGIIVVDSQQKNSKKIFHYYRKPQKNQFTDKYCIAQLLWKEEAIAVLNEAGIIKGVKSKAKPILWQLLSNTLDKDTLSEKVREKLKLRVNWKSDELLFQNGGYFRLSAKL